MKRTICRYFGAMVFVSGMFISTQSSTYGQFPGGTGGLGGGSFGSTGGLGGLGALGGLTGGGFGGTGGLGGLGGNTWTPEGARKIGC
ncbi:MAG: hypothetical protein ACKOAH_13645 [Pirellula sp.]